MTTAGPDPLWSEIRRVNGDETTRAMLKFAKREFGAGILDAAWHDFGLSDACFDSDTVDLGMFLPWFFYKWAPAPDGDTTLPANRADAFPVAAAYLRWLGERADPLLARYIETAIRAPFSYFDVVSVTPGQSMVLHDIMSGREFTITERTASTFTRAGCILFGTVVTVDHVAVIDALGRTQLPPDSKLAVLDLRTECFDGPRHVTAGMLREVEVEMLDLYDEMSTRLHNPGRPVLQNTDGDPLMFCSVTFRVKSAAGAYTSLRELAMGIVGDDDLLSEATYNDSGDLIAVSIPWLKPGNAKHASWDNTVLGHIEIDGTRVVAQVNSEARAVTFRSLAQSLLPAGSRYVSTRAESLEEARDRLPAKRASDDAETAALHDSPEVQARMAEFMAGHYAAWIDTELPALGGKTPRACMRTRDGSERVGALLSAMEQRAEDSGRVQNLEIIGRTRAALEEGVEATERTVRVR